MSLWIYGKESIEELEELVVTLFEDIPNKQVDLPSYSEPHPFPIEWLKKIFKVVPTKDNPFIDIKLFTSSTKYMWKSKPGEYISFIIGHEGKNSLLSYLIKEGLASELSCSNNHIFDACDYFKINVKLTEKGERNYQQVIRVVFAALNFLRQNDLKKYIFDEMVAMNKIKFENQTKDGPIRTWK